MSATTGMGEPAQISLSASAASASGTAQRTMSQPASASARICASVAFASRVSVLVMDCIAMGAPPPMGTPRTMICLVCFISCPFLFPLAVRYPPAMMRTMSCPVT